MFKTVNLAGRSLKPTAAPNMVMGQVQSGLTTLSVRDPRQELKIVTTVGGGLITVIMEKIYQSAAFLVRSVFLYGIISSMDDIC